MKNLFIILTVLAAISCSKTPHPEYVEFSGKIVNAKSDTITIYAMGGESMYLTISEDGTFKDQVKLKHDSTRVQLMLPKDQLMSALYVENGADIHMEADVKEFRKTLKFSGDFAGYNNYLNSKSMIQSSSELFNPKTSYRLDQEAFEKQLSTIKDTLIFYLNSHSDIPADKRATEITYIDQYLERLFKNYEEEHSFALKLEKGTPSPVFEDYENFNGSTTSLSDFKGKYVFIDVWATWCTPCKAQIPYLEELEKEYHDKNIVFVSMSVDQPKDREKWKNMVTDKNMSGVQILAPNAFGSEFTKAYNINSIPRFILIDPDGNIVDFDAPRPSNKEAIKELFSIL